MRIFLWKAINLLVLCCVLFGYQSFAVNRSQEVSAYEKKVEQAKKAWEEVEAAKNPDGSNGQSSESAQYTDGVYEGSGTGFGGEIKVQVTIQDGGIQAVEILSAKGETPEYLESAKAILEDVVQDQTPEVDTVSGATLSSNGILEGIRKALEQA